MTHFCEDNFPTIYPEDIVFAEIETHGEIYHETCPYLNIISGTQSDFGIGNYMYFRIIEIMKDGRKIYDVEIDDEFDNNTTRPNRAWTFSLPLNMNRSYIPFTLAEKYKDYLFQSFESAFVAYGDENTVATYKMKINHLDSIRGQFHCKPRSVFDVQRVENDGIVFNSILTIHHLYLILAEEPDNEMSIETLQPIQLYTGILNKNVIHEILNKCI